jgi:RecA/RadA recombinase
VGDKSSGKTLLAIEAASNFASNYQNGKIWYREAEAAFDIHYAAGLGLPVGRVDFGKDGIDTAWDTIEDIFEDLDKCIVHATKEKIPGLYIIDSLDALSSRGELKREVGQGSYGTDKAKMLSELFRCLAGPLKRSRICLIVISQIRDRIGVMFGEKHGRSGGHALDFYASQVVWLHHIKTLHREIKGIKRPTAIQIKAKCKKNKISMPLRECEFTIRFGYGVDDLHASLNWLAEAKRLDLIGSSEDRMAKLIKEMDAMEDKEYREMMSSVRQAVNTSWREVEDNFKPTRRKYA